MGRTQIYLGSEELELLDRVARATGASRSELVRCAVRSTFGQPTKAGKLQALEASAGSWRGRAFTGSEHVDAARGDLDDSLTDVDAPPPDYAPPVLVYVVEEAREADGIAQIGGFFSEVEATKLLGRLAAEGRDAHINTVPIHRRAVDYEYDR